MSIFDRRRLGETHLEARAIDRRVLALLADGLDWPSAVAQATQEADDAEAEASGDRASGRRTRSEAGRTTLTAAVGGSPRARRGRTPGKVTRTSRLAGARIYRSAEQTEAPSAPLDALAGLAGGDALPAALRAQMEAALGFDLSAVRVHTGADADQIARALGAHAFAIGRDIGFRAGAYDPASAAGVHLIAHEVAHTTQEPARAHADAPAISHPHDPSEREADAFADRFIAARTARPAADAATARPAGGRELAPPPPAAATVHRQASGDAQAGPHLKVETRAPGTLDVSLDGISVAQIGTPAGPAASTSLSVSGQWDPNKRTYDLTITYGTIAKVSITADGLTRLRKRRPGLQVRMGVREAPASRLVAPPPKEAGAPPASAGVRRSLAQQLVTWQRAGYLDPPARPPSVPAFPPLEVTEEDLHDLDAGLGAPAIAGVAAPLLRPEAAPAVQRPILRVIEGGKNLAPRTGPGPAGALRWFGAITVGLTILLTPTETAPPWMDEVNPINYRPYASPQEYDWVRRLTPEQRDYLRRISAGPAAETTAEPAPSSDASPDLDPADERRNRRNPKVDFYHGTDVATSLALEQRTPVSSLGKGEFGRGFYTFVQQPPAEVAARDYTRSRGQGAAQWGVVQFGVPIRELAAFGMTGLVKRVADLPGVLFFPDERTPVDVIYPGELGGHTEQMSWAQFVTRNTELRRQLKEPVSWPYDLIIGPLKGRLAGIDRAGLDQYLFNHAGIALLNSPTVSRAVVATGTV